MTDEQLNLILERLGRIGTALETPSAQRSPGSTKGEGIVAVSTAPETRPRPGSPVPETGASPGLVTLAPVEIRSFLESRAIQLRRTPDPKPADPVFDRLANFIGTRFRLVERVLDSIKRTTPSGGRWKLHLAGAPQEVISAACQLCTWLHSIAFLSEYRCHRAPRCLLEARPSPIPEAQNFLSGQWIERFVRLQIEEAKTMAGLRSLQLLANAQVIQPNHEWLRAGSAGLRPWGHLLD